MSNRKGIMLCYPFEEKRLAKWPAAIVQPKLDGDRCRAIIDGAGNVTLLSSEEHEITSVPHIVRALQDLRLTNLELDGELYTHGMLHQDIRSIVGRSRNLSEDFISMQYHVFDLVNQDFQVGRMNLLRNILPTNNTWIKPVPWKAAKNNITDIMSIMDEYVEQGYEGIILRNPFNAYKRKRSTEIMKFKPRKMDYYRIVGFVEEVSIDGILKNALGAFICEDDMGTRFKVGSGPCLTREARINYWERRDELVGAYAEVKYQHLSKDHIPRFPIIARVCVKDEII